MPTSKYKSLWNMELTTDNSCFLLNGVSYIHHFLSLAFSPEKRSNTCFMQHWTEHDSIIQWHYQCDSSWYTAVYNAVIQVSLFPLCPLLFKWTELGLVYLCLYLMSCLLLYVSQLLSVKGKLSYPSSGHVFLRKAQARGNSQEKQTTVTNTWIEHQQSK